MPRVGWRWCCTWEEDSDSAHPSRCKRWEEGPSWGRRRRAKTIEYESARTVKCQNWRPVRTSTNTATSAVQATGCQHISYGNNSNDHCSTGREYHSSDAGREYDNQGSAGNDHWGWRHLGG